MKEKGTDVIEKYNLEVQKAGKARAAILLTTPEGPYLLKECLRTEQRLQFEQQIHKALETDGRLYSDVIIENIEGNLLTCDGERKSYIIKKWYEGKECDPREPQDVYLAAEYLALFHSLTYGKIKGNDKLSGDNLIQCYERYNRELQRARNFVRGKHHKTDFELELMKGFDAFFNNCKSALDELRASEYPSMYQTALECGEIVHGDYNYHNIMFIEGRTKAAVVNYESACLNLRILDLYNFLRKVMEKNDWNCSMGVEILECYDKVRTISPEERKLLKILLGYPEKFRKVVNYYFNGNKSWISVKNMEKLILVHKQMELREKFVQFL